MSKLANAIRCPSAGSAVMSTQFAPSALILKMTRAPQTVEKPRRAA
jgi:hypothetical protein